METDNAKLKKFLADARSELDSGEGNDAFATLSRGEFLELLSASLSALEQEPLSFEQAKALWVAFAPTSDWDDMGGSPNIGNMVFGLVEKIYGSPHSE